MINTGILINIFLYILFTFTVSLPVSTEKTDSPQLIQIFIDSELFSEYTYTGENKISEEKSRYVYVKYNYDAKNQLISSVSYLDLSLASSNSRILEAGKKRLEWVNPSNSLDNREKTFEYDMKGELIKMSDEIGYCNFKYDSKNRICKQLFHQKENRNGYIDYLYDRKGNLLKMCTFDLDESGKSHLMTTFEYEYDNKLNPFKSFGLFMFPGKYTNRNNIAKEIYTLHIMDNEKQVKKYDYEYNAEGYPVSINKNMKYVYKSSN